MIFKTAEGSIVKINYRHSFILFSSLFYLCSFSSPHQILTGLAINCPSICADRSSLTIYNGLKSPVLPYRRPKGNVMQITYRKNRLSTEIILIEAHSEGVVIFRPGKCFISMRTLPLLSLY